MSGRFDVEEFDVSQARVDAWRVARARHILAAFEASHSGFEGESLCAFAMFTLGRLAAVMTADRGAVNAMMERDE